ncbi:hypothetical protein QBC32DRAFT_316483 [Pseudoneurospora amorphoporcata]|uniref:Uncharacterized protein n=1 Tax=Pseudoneurospora amorphoporcata TaxID=241081 RepID=A0AAN6NRI6_9PEZI|nr:hypothetical protein QBC32DRAFT_316483 [Pseudoneurospora amorphoporcata]
MSSQSSNKMNTDGKPKSNANKTTTTTTVVKIGDILVTGTKVTIPASFGRRSGASAPNMKVGSKTSKKAVSDDKPKHTYGEDRYCTCHPEGEDGRLEDDDWSDMEERGAWESD